MKKMHCPTCGNTFDPDKSQALPFCSLRCREVDMGRWLEEQHSIPSDPETAAEDDSADSNEDERQE